MTIVISFNSLIFTLNNYIAKHFLSIGYWYWVLVLPGTNNIRYWVLGGFLGIVRTLLSGIGNPSVQENVVILLIEWFQYGKSTISEQP